MCRLLVIEDKILTYAFVEQILILNLQSDEQNDDKEEQAKNPKEGNNHMRIRFQTESIYKYILVTLGGGWDW